VRVGTARVAAIAEPMEQPLTPSIERLHAQEQLVRRLAARHAAILPARFGSFTADETKLRAFLRTRAAALGRALDRVRDSEQMIVRLFVGTGRRPAGPLSGTRYLRRRAAADVPAVAAIRLALARLRIVHDERVEVQETSITMYHLIGRGGARPYSAAVHDAVIRESGVAAVVSGPWPPYAFAPDLVE
jgi:hypothetical protein